MLKMAEVKKERFWELEDIFWFTFSHKHTLQLPSYKLVVQIDDRWRGGMESWLDVFAYLGNGWVFAVWQKHCN